MQRMNPDGSTRLGTARILVAGTPPMIAALLVTAILLTGCGAAGLGGAGGTPSVGQTASVTPGDTSAPFGSATPDSASPTASLPGSGSSGPSSPTDSGAPASPEGPTPTPSDAGATASCGTPTPLRVQRISAAPRRTTEVVTVVSDGRNITPGTREQSDFLTPVLKGPDATENTDDATLRRVTALVATSGKNRVLVSRPSPPDTKADANSRPFNAAGTYVLFNASTPLNAEVIVTCGGQEQRWTFSAESDATTGQVNCAVEPPKSNGIARLVYQNNC